MKLIIIAAIAYYLFIYKKATITIPSTITSVGTAQNSASVPTGIAPV